MNYYEELGVGRDGKNEEIRQAYKTLARLLHPDSQADEKLKLMAERQMQRLNEMLGTLTDPQKRRAYDESLGEPRPGIAAIRKGAGRRPGPPLPGSLSESLPEPAVSRGAEWVQAAVRYWFWVLVAAIGVGTAGVWLAIPSERNVPEVIPLRSVRAPERVETEPRKDPPKRMRSRAPAAPAEEEAAEQTLPDRSGQPAARADVAEAAGEQREPVETPIEAVSPAESQSPFIGNWFFVSQPEKTAIPERYPAIYVECLLQEEGGDLVGSYRAKYKITDKTISPEVTLRIRGRAKAGSPARAEWTSGNGAKGIVEMTLQAPGTMSVTWWTTEFAAQAQLTSGSASLVRQQAP